jgi:arginine utilization protein RocB
MSQADYLNEMGISTWVVRSEGEGEPSSSKAKQEIKQETSQAESFQEPQLSHQGIVWTFVVDQLSGDAALLFDKILASLMLSRNTIQLLSSKEALAGKVSGQVVIAMGSQMGRQLLQMDDGFEELRGAVHSLEQAEDELPVVLTYHPEHLLNKPSDKAKTWQDMLLARSLI